MFERWSAYILRGLTVVLPIAATAWALWTVIGAVDGWFQPTDEQGRHLVPGLGFLIILILATTVGFLAEARSTRRKVAAVEKWLGQIPLVKVVYGTLKDFVDAFLGKKKRFDKPVLVSLGGGFDAQVIGFVTREDLSAIGILDKVAVYFPQSYNIGGNLLILPRERLTPLDADCAAVMTFLVSGGVAHMPEMSDNCPEPSDKRAEPSDKRHVPSDKKRLPSDATGPGQRQLYPTRSPRAAL